MSNVFEKIGEAKEAVASIAEVLHAIEEIKSLKDKDGEPVLKEFIKEIGDIQEHSKLLIADFERLKELAGLEFELIKAALHAHAEKEAA